MILAENFSDLEFGKDLLNARHKAWTSFKKFCSSEDIYENENAAINWEKAFAKCNIQQRTYI